MSADIGRYAHPHTFPNGNTHRHVHPKDGGHPDDLIEAHPNRTEWFACVDCEPWRAQSAAIAAEEPKP